MATGTASWTAASKTGLTVINYRLYNNGTQILEVGNVLTTPLTLADGSSHSITVRAVFSDTSLGGSSNVKIADLTSSSGYTDPSTQSDIAGAWDFSTTPLAVDLSGTVEDTSKDFVAAGGSFTTPSASGGYTVFDGVSDLIKLSSSLNLGTGDYTRVMSVIPDDLTNVAATYKTMINASGNVSQIVVGPTSGKLSIRANGTTADSTVDTSNMTVGSQSIITLKRKNEVSTIQFGNSTEIVLTADTTADHVVSELGGNFGYPGRELAFRIKKMLVFTSAREGDDLVNDRNWVS